MTLKNGRFVEQDTEEILDAMMADAKEYFGSDLNDTSLNVIRTFYRPIAEKLAILQEDIGLVLDASQIDYAEGDALDLLTALIGVKRDPAEKATGQVTFSRDTKASTDYSIPKGTIVQTDSNTPVKFETTEGVILASGTTSVKADIRAVEGGVRGNVGPNTITVMPDKPTGVEDVTNAAETTGGSARETDDELRQRAKDELAQGSRASAPALINSVLRLDGVTSVTIFVNDTNNDNTGSGGLPDHSFELVVAGGNKGDIAEEIIYTKAAGDTDYSGANGTAVSASVQLPNGQTMTGNFSRPTEVKIHVDATITKTSSYAGDDAVRSAIVEYIGGLLPSGNDAVGLKVGEDVIYTELLSRIQDVDGVYDVTTLEVGTSADPTGTSNVAIASSDVATSDGTDSSLNITTNNK